MRQLFFAGIACLASVTAAGAASFDETGDLPDTGGFGLPTLFLETERTTIAGSLATQCSTDEEEIFADCSIDDDADFLKLDIPDDAKLVGFSFRTFNVDSTITDPMGVPLERIKARIGDEGSTTQGGGAFELSGLSIIGVPILGVSISSGLYDSFGTTYQGTGTISFDYEFEVFLDIPSAAVPLPASVWILGSGLSLLLASSRVARSRRRES